MAEEFENDLSQTIEGLASPASRPTGGVEQIRRRAQRRTRRRQLVLGAVVAIAVVTLVVIWPSADPDPPDVGCPAGLSMTDTGTCSTCPAPAQLPGTYTDAEGNEIPCAEILATALVVTPIPG